MSNPPRSRPTPSASILRGRAGSSIEAEHRARYWWAADYVEGKEVLDAGLRHRLRHGHARRAPSRPARGRGHRAADALERARALAPWRDELAQGDVRELPFDDSSFDVVVCFEVIEHIERQDEALDEIRRVLRETGCLLISSPNRDVYTPGNPHHVHEYAPDELEAALEQPLRARGAVPPAPLAEHRRSAGGPPRTRRLARRFDRQARGGETYTLALASASPVEPPRAAGRARQRVRGALVERAARATSGATLEEAARAPRSTSAPRTSSRDASRRLLDLEQRVARLPEMEHQFAQLQADAAEVEIHRQIVQGHEVVPELADHRAAPAAQGPAAPLAAQPCRTA